MDDLLTRLLKAYRYLTPRDSSDHAAVECPHGRLVSFMRKLRDAHGFDLLVDVTALDADDESPRFTCYYHLYATAERHYLRVVSACLGEAEPSIPSLVEIWPAANWHERETYDMFGITFAGHPDLRRILMWEGYPYYPLRKDFPLAGIETDLPAPEVVEATGARVIAAPMMGGPFHADPEGGPMSEREPRADDESWSEQQAKPEGGAGSGS